MNAAHEVIEYDEQSGLTIVYSVSEGLHRFKEIRRSSMSVNEYDYDHALEALEKRRVEEATKRDEAQKVTEQHRKNEAAFAAAAELLQMHKDTGINLTQSFRLERFVNIFLGAANVWDGVRDNGA